MIITSNKRTSNPTKPTFVGIGGRMLKVIITIDFTKLVKCK